MQEVDLIITGAKALLLDSQNTILEQAAVAVKADEIIAVGQSDQILKKYRKGL